MQDQHISTSPFPLNAILNIVLAMGLLSFAALAYTGEFYWLVLPLVVVFGALPFYNFKWFFWLFIFTLPLSIDVGVGSLSISLPDEPFMIAMLYLFILLLVHNKNAVPKWLWKNSITLIILLQLFWTILSVYTAEIQVYSLKFLVSKMWYLVSFLFIPAMMVKDKADFKRMFLLICIPLLLHTIFAFSWHATKGFGYYASNVIARPFYKNHVDYGAAISMIIPAFIISFSLLKGKKGIQKIILLIILFLLIATYFSFSRAAILAVIFAVIVMIAIKIRKVNLILPSFYALILTLIFTLSYNNKYIDFRPNKEHNATQKTFIETVTGAFTGKDMSSMERFYRWIASIRMIEDNPWTGVGPNNWYFYYKSYSVTSFTTWVSRNPERSTTHNYFLLMATEQGIPAMILYGVLMIVLLAKAQKVYHRFDDPDYKKYTLIVAMIIAASFVNNFFSEFLETHKIGGLFYLSVALLIVLDHQSKKSPPEVGDAETVQ